MFHVTNDTHLDRFTADELAILDKIRELDAFVAKMKQEELVASDVVRKAAFLGAGWVGALLYIAILIYASIADAGWGTTHGNNVAVLMVAAALLAFVTYKLIERFHPQSKVRFKAGIWLPAYREARALKQKLTNG